MKHMPVISNDNGEPLLEWVRQHQVEIEGVLSSSGIVLLRGFDSTSESILEDVLTCFNAELMEDARWSSPRSLVAGKTFTASEYPKTEEILLHSEMSYLRHWPRLLAFQCKRRASTGGATSVCHLDALSEDLSSVLEDFRERGVQYIRNYRPNIDIPWQNAFGTSDKEEVAKVAAANNMSLEWLNGDVLRTKQICQGTILSENDIPLWFNQSHIFHPSRLPSATREGLEKLFGVDGMPRSVTYGDGSPIEKATIDYVQEAMKRHIQDIDWHAGDVAVLDNMRWMHGRRPFDGDRLVTVALGREQRNVKRTPLFGPEVATGLDSSVNPPLPGDKAKSSSIFARLFG